MVPCGRFLVEGYDIRHVGLNRDSFEQDKELQTTALELVALPIKFSFWKGSRPALLGYELTAADRAALPTPAANGGKYLRAKNFSLHLFPKRY